MATLLSNRNPGSPSCHLNMRHAVVKGEAEGISGKESRSAIEGGGGLGRPRAAAYKLRREVLQNSPSSGKAGERGCNVWK